MCDICEDQLAHEHEAAAVPSPVSDITTEPEMHYEEKLPPYYRRNETGEVIEITKAEYKKAMLAEFTKKYTVNPSCGHKVRVGFEPNHRNCEACWFAYFTLHGEVTRLAVEIFQQHGHAEGSEIVRQIKGRTFLSNYLKYMSTLASYQEAAKLSGQDSSASTSG